MFREQEDLGTLRSWLPTSFPASNTHCADSETRVEDILLTIQSLFRPYPRSIGESCSTQRFQLYLAGRCSGHIQCVEYHPQHRRFLFPIDNPGSQIIQMANLSANFAQTVLVPAGTEQPQSDFGLGHVQRSRISRFRFPRQLQRFATLLARSINLSLLRIKHLPHFPSSQR